MALKEPPPLNAFGARVLESFPARREDVEWDVVDGRVALAVPKRYGRFERVLARVFPGPEVVFVTLDDLGTEAWLAADGTRTAREAAEVLRAVFGERAEPADRRAAAFYVDLARRGFVRLFDAARPVDVAVESRGFTEDRGYRRTVCRACRREHPVRAQPGTRFACARCGAINRVPRA